MLQQVRAVLPRGADEWKKVVSNYNALQGSSCNLDRIRDKFNKMAKSKKLTRES